MLPSSHFRIRWLTNISSQSEVLAHVCLEEEDVHWGVLPVQASGTEFCPMKVQGLHYAITTDGLLMSPVIPWVLLRICWRQGAARQPQGLSVFCSMSQSNLVQEICHAQRNSKCWPASDFLAGGENVLRGTEIRTVGIYLPLYSI